MQVARGGGGGVGTGSAHVLLWMVESLLRQQGAGRVWWGRRALNTLSWNG